MIRSANCFVLLKVNELCELEMYLYIQLFAVLSDANKRFLYDVGVYDSGDDDDENVITLLFYNVLFHAWSCGSVSFFLHFERTSNGVLFESQEMG